MDYADEVLERLVKRAYDLKAQRDHFPTHALVTLGTWGLLCRHPGVLQVAPGRSALVDLVFHGIEIVGVCMDMYAEPVVFSYYEYYEMKDP